MTPTQQELKFKRQSDQKIEWKQTEGQTDATDCFAFPANAIGKNTDRRTEVSMH